MCGLLSLYVRMFQLLRLSLSVCYLDGLTVYVFQFHVFDISKDILLVTCVINCRQKHFAHVFAMHFSAASRGRRNNTKYSNIVFNPGTFPFFPRKVHWNYCSWWCSTDLNILLCPCSFGQRCFLLKKASLLNPGSSSLQHQNMNLMGWFIGACGQGPRGSPLSRIPL